jgi:hypothetical protein
LTATLRAQPDETATEYEARLAAAAAAWAAFHPRDHEEQWIAAQLVALHYAALDNLSRAMETPNNAEAARLRSGHAGLIRTSESLTKLLERLQRRPTESLRAPPIVSFAPEQPVRPRTDPRLVATNHAAAVPAKGRKAPVLKLVPKEPRTAA